MTTRKYEITDQAHPDNPALHRIRALRAFGDVRKGALGGYIEHEKNLLHTDTSWVFDDAWVFGNAQISATAQVSGTAQVFGNARVFGTARVSGNAWVFDDARVFDDAQVLGNAWVFGNARVFGNAWVSGNPETRRHVSGDTWLSSDAHGDTYEVGPLEKLARISEIDSLDSCGI